MKCLPSGLALFKKEMKKRKKKNINLIFLKKKNIKTNRKKIVSRKSFLLLNYMYIYGPDSSPVLIVFILFYLKEKRRFYLPT